MPASDRIPEEGPHFSERKEVKFIVRIVADEPWIQGKIWGVHKRWEMSTDGGGTWSLGSSCLSDERYSESLKVLMVTVPGKTFGHLHQSDGLFVRLRWSGCECSGEGLTSRTHNIGSSSSVLMFVFLTSTKNTIAI